MDLSTLFFLSSGLFLGWTFGANNMSSVFGTAIGTRMLSFKTAAIIASILIVLGAVFSGAGVSQTLQDLGQINTLAGAFITTLSAGVSLFFMTRAGLPVSSTQAIVGALIGWSLFVHVDIQWEIVSQIVVSWFTSPLLAILIAFLLTVSVKSFLKVHPVPMLYRDAYTRLGLVLAGAFCAYALGANNIGNIMAPFVRVISLPTLQIGSLFELSSAQQLFLIGGLAIVVGIFTYSKKVNTTIGQDVLQMSSIEAFIAIMSQGIVLLLFSSVTLHQFLVSRNLPAFPLVPISSIGAIVGGLIGVSLTKKGQGLKVKMLLRIMSAWIITPIIAAAVCFLALFFMQNVFGQEVF
ncbi:MAG: inorganic phosphate transporter [Alphaproteobacteria bacterium]|nr:inorganic phosphate transporter [Alphaproteobacteria bacterium]